MKHVALLLSLFVFRFGGQTSVVCVNTTTLGGSYRRYTQQGGGLRKGEENDATALDENYFLKIQRIS